MNLQKWWLWWSMHLELQTVPKLNLLLASIKLYYSTFILFSMILDLRYKVKHGTTLYQGLISHDIACGSLALAVA